MRNIGIIAHIDAGKTTTTERILYYTGRTHRLGETHNGESVMDYLPSEKERGITITSAATTCTWREEQINIVDTPGHVDFTAEVERSLRVLDGAVAIFCAKGGVEPQSETVWRQADKYGVPRLAYINKMDAMGADFQAVVEQMEARLGTNPAVITLPFYENEEFSGLIDLVNLSCLRFEDRLGNDVREESIPEAMAGEVAAGRQRLVETAAEADEALMELFLDDQPVATSDLQRALRQGTISGQLVPVLCGSSYRNIGVQRLLDAILDYLPSPSEAEPVKAWVDGEEDAVVLDLESSSGPLAALVFKIISDRHVGRLAFVRIYSGQLKAGSYVYNSVRGRKEHIGRLLRMHANHREEVDVLKAGDIGAVIGLKEAITGDTLANEEYPLMLENISFPEPVISIAIEARKKSEQVRIGEALARIAVEDPTFRVSIDPETGETLIWGMGELHLEIVAERLLREFRVEADLGQPKVAYRETITRPANGECKYAKQSGGRGQFAHVKLSIEPAEGLIVEHRIVGGAIPREYLPAVEAGVREALAEGVIKGYPVVNLKVTVLDGSYHEVDSSELAFKLAGSMAVKEALRKAAPRLLEPVMKLEITTPEEFTGNIINNLTSKRGRLASMDNSRNTQILRSFVPLAELFGYSTAIRSLTQGRASFSMEFSHYQATEVAV